MPGRTPAGLPGRSCGVLAVATAALLAAPAASADDGGLRLERCVPVEPAALAAALSSRLARPVGMPEDGAAPGSWSLAIDVSATGAVLSLRSPSGEGWSREVELAADASESERLRAVALAAEFLLTLARAPFAPPDPILGPAPELPPPGPDSAPELVPPPPEGPPGGAADGAREAVEGGATDGFEPPSRLRLDGALLAGGSGDLSAFTRGKAAAFAAGLRWDATWSWGLWLEVDAAWHWVTASSPEELSLHQVPIRAGVGAALPWEEWAFRLAFQAVIEPWWTTGGTVRSGWRTGGGLLLAVGVKVAPWVEVGVDLGVEMMPHGIELLYGDEAVFSLGPWRGRAAAWVAFGGEPVL